MLGLTSMISTPLIGSNMRVFGTDGVRGEIDLEGAEKIEGARILWREKRTITNPLLRAMGALIAEHIIGRRGAARIAIGWDNRPSNQDIGRALMEGACSVGGVIEIVGLTSTPGLVLTQLELKCDAGWMITASHNPVSDSGLKWFDENGYKSFPEAELEIEKKLEEMDYSPPPGKIDWVVTDLAEKTYKRHLTSMMRTISWDCIASVTSNPLILDGAGSDLPVWFSKKISENQIECVEISNDGRDLNANCGAAGFNPGDKWGWEELRANKQEHVLLHAISKREKELEKYPTGTIIGVALDGDGDRCLAIEKTSGGVGLIDGDRMASEIVLADLEREWTLARTIESDLGLPRIEGEIGTILQLETAVGDRWLANALLQSVSADQMKGLTPPAIIGSEDSGHVIMPVIYPHTKESWYLLGDGSATFLQFLRARSKLKQSHSNLISKIRSATGWKQRVSVHEVNQMLWDPDGELALKIENEFVERLYNESGVRPILKKRRIEGEISLLLLEGNWGENQISLAIRNSGTETRTNATFRVDTANPICNPAPHLELIRKSLLGALKIID